MAVGRPHDKAKAAENLRVVLGCSTTERSIDAAMRIVAENAKLKQKIEDLEKALRVAWGDEEEERKHA
jgi:hypothetical protein